MDREEDRERKKRRDREREEEREWDKSVAGFRKSYYMWQRYANMDKLVYLEKKDCTLYAYSMKILYTQPFINRHIFAETENNEEPNMSF